MRESDGSTPATPGDSPYKTYWDWYVGAWHDRDPHALGAQVATADQLEWPGDEWGHEDWWEFVFEQLFDCAGVRGWKRAVEIGPGSGKYTLPVLENSKATVRAFDVSPRFLDVCRDRCSEHVASGRLELELINTHFAGAMLADLTQKGWRGTVDGFYSIAAMVHVDLQYMIVYLLTAALSLRHGGRLVMTFATATNEKGFEKLVGDIAYSWRHQGDNVGGSKYEWVSREMIEMILQRLGFELEFVSDEPHRDLHVVASLRHPELAKLYERELFPAMKGLAA